MFFTLLRFLKGYISVKVYGGFFENFINSCNEKNIPLRDIRYIDGTMYFYSREKYRIAIEEIASNSGNTAEIISSFGISYIFKKRKERFILLFGMFFAICFVWIMSGRIWIIEVSGNDKLFDSRILNVINDLGVNVGCKKSDINVIEVREEFLKIMNEDVLWFSLNIDGMCAKIEIREIVKTENDSINKPCNYVADFSGTITTYRVFSGTPEVKTGSYVRKGELLINSVIEYYAGKSAFSEADGLICARHNKYVDTVGRKYNRFKKYTETKPKYSLVLFSLEIPLTFSKNDSNAEVTVERKYLTVKNKKLPFALVKYVYSYYEYEDFELNQKFLLAEYLKETEFQTRNSRVLALNTVKTSDIIGQKYSGKIDCIDFMGEKIVVNIEDN